ncbi:MAG: efflux RND transporter periplasmic adaptor subunit [Rhodobacteraceae bacterium]|nr:efflux RND transporter periplasmic adaptor subunit [Paracoccaceae bacterium]
MGIRLAKSAFVLAGMLAFAASPVIAEDQGYTTGFVTVTSSGGSATVGGTVIPYKEVTLSAQIPGRITFLAGVEGHRAALDEVIVTIDDDDLQAQKAAALAQIYNADAAFRNSQMQYSRELYSPRQNSVTTMPGMGAPGLFDQFFTRGFSDMIGQSDSGLERQADLFASGAGISQAQGGLLQAQANLDAIEARLRDARQLAPFDGVILEKMVEVGDTVQPGMPLVKFAYIDFLRVLADVPVRLASGLEVGMIVPARLDAGGAEVQVRVAQIYPVADALRHTVAVKFDLPQGTPGGPGMYVEVTVPDGSIPVSAQPAVPSEALIWRGSLPSVFVLEDGKPSLRLVRVGYPVENGLISVVSGLSGGEEVILNPPANLVSGGE